MARAQIPGTQMVLGGIEPNKMGGMRWLSPALLGLTAPLVMAAIAFPLLGSEGRMVIEAVLMLALVMSIAAYAVSVLNPGALTGFVIDEAQKTVALVREGPFAITTKALPFREIRDLRVSTRFDDDGYSTVFTEIVLQAGETIELPIALTKPEVAASRLVLGLDANVAKR